MKTWIVYVPYQNTTEWAYPTAPRGVEASIPTAVHTDFNIHENPQEQHAANLRTFHCRNQRDAEALALYFAQHQVPGQEVYVCEVRAIARTPTAEATLVSVSEKGVVPR